MTLNINHVNKFFYWILYEVAIHSIILSKEALFF